LCVFFPSNFSDLRAVEKDWLLEPEQQQRPHESEDVEIDELQHGYILSGYVTSYGYLKIFGIPSFCNGGILKLTAKAPENGWLEDDPFLLGPGLFSGANC